MRPRALLHRRVTTAMSSSPWSMPRGASSARPGGASATAARCCSIRWSTSTDGRLYLQKRPAWKDIQPGRWDTAVGGHVAYGETIDEALRREAREELGLESFEAEFVRSYVFRSEREQELVYVHRCRYDGEVRPSRELDGGRFWSLDELRAAMGRGILTPNFESEVPLLLPCLAQR